MKKTFLIILCGLCLLTIDTQAQTDTNTTDSIAADSIQEESWLRYHLRLERKISKCLRLTEKKYDVGQAVDLNDYLSWLDSTIDWRNQYIDTETEEWLNDKGVYYDADHYDWVLRKIRHAQLLEPTIYYSVSRTGIDSRMSCLCEWQLEGRRLISRLVQPDWVSDADGAVAVRIFVNSQGKVWMAWRKSGTTLKDHKLISATIDAAKQARFNEGKPQVGTITYHY